MGVGGLWGGCRVGGFRGVGLGWWYGSRGFRHGCMGVG